MRRHAGLTVPVAGSGVEGGEGQVAPVELQAAGGGWGGVVEGSVQGCVVCSGFYEACFVLLKHRMVLEAAAAAAAAAPT